MIQYRVVKTNKYGHRFIEEPEERIKFRYKCKCRTTFGGCNKGYSCYYMDGKQPVELFGCTPGVDCPRLRRWDKRQGIEGAYTMVENANYE